MITQQTMIPTVRKVDFDFSGVEKHYLGGNAVATHFLNSMHLIFPDGERFFIRSVKTFAKDLNDQDLKDRVNGFIGQEIQHGKEHEKFWQLLRDQGFNIDVFLRLYNKSAYGFLEKLSDRLFGRKLSLSATAALEHYTATFAEGAFDDSLAGVMPESIRKMLTWHAAEEIEHKAVAYDVLQQTNPGYVLRLGGFLIASIVLLGYALIGTAIFLWQDKDFKIYQFPGQLIKALGLGLKRHKGNKSNTLANMLDYFRPSFHPDDHENYGLADEFFARDKYFEQAMQRAS